MAHVLHCTLRLQSNHAQSLEKTLEILRKEGVSHGLHIGGDTSYPMKKKVFTVLRSPHIDKKSREQFEIRTYAKSVQIQNAEDTSLNAFLTAIKENLSIDVSIQVKFTSMESMVTK